jgi:hypothetical protein
MAGITWLYVVMVRLIWEWLPAVLVLWLVRFVLQQFLQGFTIHEGSAVAAARVPHQFAVSDHAPDGGFGDPIPLGCLLDRDRVHIS